MTCDSLTNRVDRNGRLRPLSLDGQSRNLSGQAGSGTRVSSLAARVRPADRKRPSTWRPSELGRLLGNGRPDAEFCGAFAKAPRQGLVYRLYGLCEFEPFLPERI